MPDIDHNKARILIVDDQEQNVALLEQMLASRGFTNIASTVDSRKVLDMYLNDTPDLILLDLKMPYLDGFQVMQQLKEVEHQSYLPILVLTANSDPKTRLRALDAGAKDFVGKPFDMIEVMTRIHNMLEVRLMHNELERQRNSLEHFVNPATRRFTKESAMTKAASVTRTVLFADLRSFTTYSEQAAPEEVFDLLEDILELQSGVVELHGGEVDKFIGDCVMGVFKDEANALNAARDLIDVSTERLNEKSLGHLLPGVGIHTGTLMEGVIGRDGMRTYTLIGDVVNIAARLCAIAKGGEVLVSQEIRDALPPESTQHLSCTGEVTLKGRDASVNVWSQTIVSKIEKRSA